jgi:hypothetical protein
MKSTPILLSDSMVPPVLLDIKTQTRRICNPQPSQGSGMTCWPNSKGEIIAFTDGFVPGLYLDLCPYGKVGDTLWVRETHYLFGHWEQCEQLTKKMSRKKVKFVTDLDDVRFVAPAQFRKSMHSQDAATPAWHKRLGRFMRRIHSRITLEIVSVRVERLQAITEADCIAEGATGGHASIPVYNYAATPREHYAHIWESINGTGSWDLNPWVWVIEFKRVLN